MTLEKPSKDASVGIRLETAVGEVTPKVKLLTPGGIAEAAGLQVGDKIKLIKEKPAPLSAVEATNLIKAEEAGPLRGAPGGRLRRGERG